MRTELLPRRRGSGGGSGNHTVSRALKTAMCAGTVPGEGPLLIAEIYDSAFDEVLRAGRAAQKKTTAILLLASGAENKFSALCSAKGVDLRSLLAAAVERRGGKGGGGAGFFQGIFESRDALENFLGDVI